jgi:hypothetical protein
LCGGLFPLPLFISFKVVIDLGVVIRLAWVGVHFGSHPSCEKRSHPPCIIPFSSFLASLENFILLEDALLGIWLQMMEKCHLVGIFLFHGD